MARKIVRVEIKLDGDIFDAMEARREVTGEDRTAFIVDAIRRYLDRYDFHDTLDDD